MVEQIGAKFSTLVFRGQPEMRKLDVWLADSHELAESCGLTVNTQNIHMHAIVSEQCFKRLGWHVQSLIPLKRLADTAIQRQIVGRPQVFPFDPYASNRLRKRLSVRALRHLQVSDEEIDHLAQSGCSA
ncbi:MAG: hypothetical protein ABS58_03855 [Mesorhizobium sp. SCN 65-20]|nr:MAG: hypothetical protein ABS58_03855 [Mesorhizobium sp. SCN 65-20]